MSKIIFRKGIIISLVFNKLVAKSAPEPLIAIRKLNCTVHM